MADFNLFEILMNDYSADTVYCSWSKHLKKSNAACFYMPIVLKLLKIVQMWKQHEEGN